MARWLSKRGDGAIGLALLALIMVIVVVAARIGDERRPSPEAPSTSTASTSTGPQTSTGPTSTAPSTSTGPQTSTGPTSTAPSTSDPETSDPETSVPPTDATRPTVVGASMSFSSARLDGAGFQNVVLVDPHGSGTLLMGGDVSGLHRSTDAGASWEAVNQGLTHPAQMQIASLMWDPQRPQRVLAAYGRDDGQGGILVSSDAGRSWRTLTRAPHFAADYTRQHPLPPLHPRSTGDLLALDPVTRTHLAATFSDGLWSSDDEGRTWQPRGLAGRYLRGLALDADDGVLWVADRETLWRARRDDQWRPEPVAGAPTEIEELALAPDGTLWLAAGSSGLWRSSGVAFELVQSGGVWSTVEAGAARDGGTIVVAGTAESVAQGPGFRSLIVSRDGGASWITAGVDTPAVTTVAGRPWWLAAENPWALLGSGAGYVASSVAIDPADPDRLVVAGRSGAWRSIDAGASWEPSVVGLSATINRGVAVDPDDGDTVFVANTDWVVLVSTDGGATVTQNRPPGGSTAFDLAVDARLSPSGLYVASGDRDANAEGEVWFDPDPAVPGGWEPTGLGQATGGKRPFALELVHQGDEPVLLAAVERGGLWRRQGQGPWQRIGSGFGWGRQPTRSMGFASGDSMVWAFDHRRGLFRSADAGASWEPVWQGRNPLGAAAGGWHTAANMSGGLALVPGTDDELVVSVNGEGLRLITGADRGRVEDGSASIEPVGELRAPGPVARVGEFLYVAELAVGGEAALWRSSDGREWVRVDDEAYRARAPLAFAIDGVGDRLYLSTFGGGLVVGRA